MDIDIYDPDSYTRGIPHEQFAWLRANDPVYWHSHPAGHGYWVLSRHRDVLAVSAISGPTPPSRASCW